jgi:hypothetical protein
MTTEAVVLALTLDQERLMGPSVRFVAQRARPRGEAPVQVCLSLNLVAALAEYLRAHVGHQKLGVGSVRIMAGEASLADDDRVLVRLSFSHVMTARAELWARRSNRELMHRLLGKVAKIARHSYYRWV